MPVSIGGTEGDSNFGTHTHTHLILFRYILYYTRLHFPASFPLLSPPVLFHSVLSVNLACRIGLKMPVCQIGDSRAGNLLTFAPWISSFLMSLSVPEPNWMFTPFTKGRNRTGRNRNPNERKDIEERERKNCAIYEEVKGKLMNHLIEREYGTKPTKDLLLVLAVEVSRATGISIDRMARRTMSPLICWFCEHIQEVTCILWPTGAPEPERTPKSVSTTVAVTELDASFFEIRGEESQSIWEEIL
jgi:hypothetical protein